jgi:mono/diheme cytochrome c family protein
LRLQGEPSSFIELAAGGGEFGSRATLLLSHIEWPGKPGMAAPVTPLTPEEQKRFDAGREVYLNLCQACHQADGRGQEKVAATLVGSTLALGPADVTARILLNGKDGPVGQMPPLGAGLSDDQIAGVLTYIRREWGNAGTAVDAQTIKDTRSAVAGRTRPWTNDELTALSAAGRGGRQ